MFGMIGQNPKNKKRNSLPVWPTGADGALVVNATTVTLPNGAVKDYSSITISNGGTLEILPGPLWTILGCLGNLSIDNAATSSHILVDPDGATIGVSNRTAPDGYPLVSSRNQAEGGKGGDSYTNFGGLGGSAMYGNGGGGGGNGIGADGGPSAGGDGAESLHSDPGGSGAPINGGNGGEGATDDQTAAPGTSAYGAGGGGGSRGKNAGLLYMKVGGSVNVTTGGTVFPIVIRGDNGGSGGGGGGGYTVDDASGVTAIGGGGAGGGGGGCGGKAVFRWKGIGTNPNTIIDTTHGDAGSPGGGGAAATTLSGTATNGNDGEPAAGGDAGTTTVATY